MNILDSGNHPNWTEVILQKHSSSSTCGQWGLPTHTLRQTELPARSRDKPDLPGRGSTTHRKWGSLELPACCAVCFTFPAFRSCRQAGITFWWFSPPVAISPPGTNPSSRCLYRNTNKILWFFQKKKNQTIRKQQDYYFLLLQLFCD